MHHGDLGKRRCDCAVDSMRGPVRLPCRGYVMRGRPGQVLTRLTQKKNEVVGFFIDVTNSNFIDIFVCIV